jgi:hypothetical protein
MKKRKGLSDAEITATLGNVANAAEKICGRLLLVEAQLEALQAAFVHSEMRRGLNREKVTKALDEIARQIATAKLECIGDTAPQAAESIDIQGLLSKMLDDLKYP